MSAGKLRKLWDSLSELRSSLSEIRLERMVLRPAILPVKTAQFTQFFSQILCHTVKSLSLTESLWRALDSGLNLSNSAVRQNIADSWAQSADICVRSVFRGEIMILSGQF